MPQMIQPSTTSSPSSAAHTYRKWMGAALLTGALAAVTGISGCVLAQPLASKKALLDMPASLQISLQRLQSHVRALSEDFLGRSFDQPETLQKAAEYIAAELAQSGLKAERQRFEVDGNSYENLIVRFGPVDSSAPLLVMGAHYDSALTEHDHGAAVSAGALAVVKRCATGRPACARLPCLAALMAASFCTRADGSVGAPPRASTIHFHSFK